MDQANVGVSVSHELREVATRPLRAAAPGEIRGFAKCRNEMLRLPAFFTHYRGLGVDRFFLVDNDSTDGTTEYLAAQPDVRVFRTSNRFSEAQGGTAWLNALLQRFGQRSWCVTADIDELLVYPGSEHASLRTLTRYLDQNGYEALSCLLLDMYPSGPLREARYTAGGDLLSASPHFDPRPYDRTPAHACPGVLIRGGLRERIFYPEFRQRGLAATLRRWIRTRGRSKPPCLTKVPLVRWDERASYLHCNHWVSPKVVAPDTGVLLHFKFLSDFHRRATEEAARGEYYDEASEYRRYAEALGRNPDLSFMYPESLRFEGSEQLVQIGLMQDTGGWAAARMTLPSIVQRDA